jgi:hypothetical protein
VWIPRKEAAAYHLKREKAKTFPPLLEKGCLGQLRELGESKYRRRGKALKRQVKRVGCGSWLLGD